MCPINQNTEKSPEDLRRLAVTQPPVEKPPANTGVKNSPAQLAGTVEYANCISTER